MYGLSNVPNTGSLSHFYYVSGTHHQVMCDWSTGWYKVIGRKTVGTFQHGNHTLPKIRTIGYSQYLKDLQSLDDFLRSIINSEQEDPSIMGWTL